MSRWDVVGRRCGMWSRWTVDGGRDKYGIWNVKNKLIQKNKKDYYIIVITVYYYIIHILVTLELL